MWRAVAPVVALLGMLTACGGPDPAAAPALPDDAVIAYAFHDASVPPPYHRSVTLTVTKDESHLVIDSYGDVLADETLATPAAVWTTLADTVTSLADLPVAPAPEGCTGGTGIELTVSSGSGTTVDLAPEFCGGSNEDLQPAINGWISPARKLFPATDELAPS